ncbi:MAG TPA: agmatine deiminase family protein [Candidatus Didemnitutus sp.]|nr:agmatine deiminase family protein [Candidatus Didemnitutus sp.]
MPAEWEPQEAVWLSWPRNRHTWPGRFRGIPRVFARIVAAISHFESVRINCAAAGQLRAQHLCEAEGADMSRVQFFNHPVNDSWCRDHGPIFVRNDRTGEVAVTDWKYNAWGGKYPPYDLDNQIPRRIADKLRLRRFVNSMVLEGGSIEVNGEGDLLTSEQCLLNPNRNPRRSRKEIELALRDFLGVRRILWLGEGIAGDDTDGHIDDMTRFLPGGGIVTCIEPNAKDSNHRPLEENLERLRSLRTVQGRPFRIVPLPMPRPFGFKGQQVPASYANYLVLNGAVLVPQFRQSRRDAEARGILGECFPGREIVGIDCYDLIWGLGTLHCISQQQPAARPPI